MRDFRYLEPRTLPDACSMLADAGPTSRPLAGGTDLVVQMEIARVQPEALVFLGEIEELCAISEEPGGGLRIGAMASLRAIEQHLVVRSRYPGLQRGAEEVGSVQIRNLATLAGNLCNASPSADTSPALLAYDAEVEIAGRAGTRRVPVTSFWTGPGRTVLQQGELVSAVLLPQVADGHRCFYQKVAVRKAMDLAMVGVCITATRRQSELQDVRIALGAVAPVCMRAHAAEQMVASGGGQDGFEPAAQAAVDAVSPISDHRASAEYRRRMVRTLTLRGLRSVSEGSA